MEDQFPSTHLHHAGPAPKIEKNVDFDSWVYRFKRHLNHVNTNLWRIIEEGFIRMTEVTSLLEKLWIINSMRMLSSSSNKQSHPKIFLISGLTPWPKMRGSRLFPSIGEAQAFNAPTMKWCKMKPTSLQWKKMKNLVSFFGE